MNSFIHSWSHLFYYWTRVVNEQFCEQLIHLFYYWNRVVNEQFYPQLISPVLLLNPCSKWTVLSTVDLTCFTTEPVQYMSSFVNSWSHMFYWTREVYEQFYPQLISPVLLLNSCSKWTVLSTVETFFTSPYSIKLMTDNKSLKTMYILISNINLKFKKQTIN